MIKIKSQQDLETLLTLPTWEEAFLREWYLLSPGYINPINQEVIASDSPPMMLMLICTQQPSCPCIELLFEGVEEIYFSCRNDLNPIASFHNGYILFSFHEGDVPDIQSRCLYYQILETDCWGWQVRYGIKNLFDQGGFLNLEKL